MAYKGSIDSGFQEPIDVPNQSSPLATPGLEGGMHGERIGVSDAYPEHQLQQHIASLKQQQQLQQQMLLEQFHHQQMYLAHEHEKQLQEHIKEYMEQQQILEQQQRIEKELLERQKLTMIKNKTADKQSAVASSAVKAKLHEFVMNKKRQQSPPQLASWISQASVEHGSPPQSTLSPPYPSLLKKYDDFPLRKTASEPNILKVRSALKQKVLERRIIQSPMMRRRENLKAMHKRKAQMSSM